MYPSNTFKRSLSLFFLPASTSFSSLLDEVVEAAFNTTLTGEEIDHEL